MGITQVAVQRFTLVSNRPFNDVVAALESAIGHPEMGVFRRDLAKATTSTDLERVVGEAVGAYGLMEFTRFDLGTVLRLYHGEQAGRSLRLLVGNPVIMKQMVEHVPDAGSYAPVTLLIDERPGGVQLSYDRMTSFLAPYKNPAAMKVAQSLDTKVEKLLTEACK